MPKDPNNPRLTCLADNDLQSPEEMRKELRQLRGKYSYADAARLESILMNVYDVKWYKDQVKKT